MRRKAVDSEADPQARDPEDVETSSSRAWPFQVQHLLQGDENDKSPLTKSTRALLQGVYRVVFAMATAGVTFLLLLLALTRGGVSEPDDGLAAGAGAAAVSDAALSDPVCPLLYERMPVEDIKKGAKPYLFGGRQRPKCTNCDRDHLWSHFCQFKSHGQLCTPRDSEWLVTTYVNRNWTQLLTLTPCDFWPFLEGRTLWVMGDSQSLDLYKALKCFLYEFWDLDGEAPPLEDPELTPILAKYLKPTCVSLPRHTRVCYVRVDPADYLLDAVLPAFPRFGSSRDLLVVNFGLHHGDKEEYRERLQTFAKYVDANRRSLPTVFWQMTTPQHFNGYQGEYPGGKPPFECIPIPGLELQLDGTLRTDNPEDDEVLLHGGWRNKMAAEELTDVGVTIVPSYNETAPLYYYHRDNGKGWECTHFCFPSAQQTWVFAVYRAFVEHATGQRLDPTTPFPVGDGGDAVASMTSKRRTW